MALEVLQDEGQSLWVDDLARDGLASGALARSIVDLAVTGATSNLAVLQRAIEEGTSYDSAIAAKAQEGKSAEKTLQELLLEDAMAAADLLRTTWKRTNGMDGWVSLPLSPLLWHDSARMLAAATEISDRGARPNLLVEVPGTDAGLVVVERAIFTRVPVNVTLLFSDTQYRAAADAYLRGLERRAAIGLKPQVGCIASFCVPGWPSPLRVAAE